MTLNEYEAKSILIKQKKIESWFLSRFNMNIYRGCPHNCAYCDGRAESYFVEGNFSENIGIKINAPNLLEKALNPEGKRIPQIKGLVCLGGGVGDSYCQIEEKYELTRKCLEVLLKYNNPVLILTKSTLIKRDVDLLKEINIKNKVITAFSFSSMNYEYSKIFEPGVPSPEQRLETISIMKKNGFYSGVFLMPVIPFITDTQQELENSIKSAKEAGANFIIFGGMTLKEGKQKDYFYNILNKYFLEKIKDYENIYGNKDKFGGAINEYNNYLYQLFFKTASKYNLPVRIPVYFLKDKINKTDYIIAALEHLDYVSKLKGQKSFYGYASYSLSKPEKPIEDIINNIRQIPGIGEFTEKIIKDLFHTGNSSYYEKMIKLI